MNKNNLILPVSILLSSLILGGFYYASQIKKLEYIEKQKKEESAIRIECFNEIKDVENIKDFSDFNFAYEVCLIKNGFKK